jgi:hypothetical protein
MSELIKKTLVWIEEGNIELVDTIEYDNKIWLVPLWLEQPALKRKRPVRLVRLDSLPHEKNGTHPDVDFVLNGKLPRHFFDQNVSDKQATLFEVVESPDIWFAYQTEE